MTYIAGVAEPGAIVLFDGVCNLCNTTVDFIIKRDPKRHFRFASLQSAAAQELLAKLGEKPTLDSIVLVENGVALHESTAALRIAKHLSGAWPLFYYAYIWVPAFLRNPFYRFVARNRYKWFGRKDSCRVPTEEERALFLG